MTTTIVIAEPASDAQALATDTRVKLAAWVESIKDQLEEQPLAPVDPADQAAAKSKGLVLFESHFRGTVQNFQGVMNAFVNSLRRFHYEDQSRVPGRARLLSYELEGLCNAVSRTLHTLGLKWTAEMGYMAFVAMQGYMHGGEEVQTFMNDKGLYLYQYGAYCVQSSWNESYEYTLDNTASSHCSWLTQREELRAQFAELPESAVAMFKPYIPVYARADSRADDPEHAPRRSDVTKAPCVMLWRYTDTDGDWVAGFLSPKDMARCRFSRKRLGAVLTDSGAYPEEVVRAAVEKAKQATSTAQFVLYPNDCNFADVYTMSGVRSCMADSASDYNSDGIHPTQVYSTSYMGAGDNGLVLFTSQTADGELTGRGIYNTATGSIVRWYGAQIPMRTLQRIGVEPHNGEALQGAWLALHKFDSRFVHPYVDGDIEYGTIEGNKVMIRTGGKYCLYETEGSSRCEDGQYCENTEREEDTESCTYQPLYENYVCDPDWTCPVINEWCDSYNRTYVWLDGEEQEISELALREHIRLTDPSYEMIQDDKDNQDWTSEEEDGPYEYAGPENYTSTY